MAEVRHRLLGIREYNGAFLKALDLEYGARDSVDQFLSRGDAQAHGRGQFSPARRAKGEVFLSLDQAEREAHSV